MGFKPLKACDMVIEKLRYPIFVQPKIDGVRGMHPKDFIVGRSLKTFANRFMQTSPIYNGAHIKGLDGELTLGENIHRADLCRTTTSALSSHDGEPNIFINAFDICSDEIKEWEYQDRLKALNDYIDEEHSKGLLQQVRKVETHLVYCEEELVHWEEKWLALGTEGLIGRDPYGRYKHGRSTVKEQLSLRLKRFADQEAVIVGFTEAMENQNEAVINELGYMKRSSHKENKVGKAMVGNIIMRDDIMGEFTVGPGNLTHLERIEMWNNQDKYVGKIGKFKHFPKGQKDTYRFATFISLRDPVDIG